MLIVQNSKDINKMTRCVIKSAYYIANASNWLGSETSVIVYAFKLIPV